MQNVQLSVPYLDANGGQQTLTVNLSLKSSVYNAAATESNSSIREKAPQVYYSQNRMITAEDYQVTGKLSIGGNYFSDGHRISVGTGDDNKFIVSASGRVAIGTADFSENKFIVSGGPAVFTDSIGVGGTTRVGAVDFYDAGKNISGAEANKMYMIPPKLTNAQQTAVTNANPVAGAIIYNTQANKLRVFNGTSFVDLN